MAKLCVSQFICVSACACACMFTCVRVRIRRYIQMGLCVKIMQLGSYRPDNGDVGMEECGQGHRRPCPSLRRSATMTTTTRMSTDGEQW